jgi:hypothetical protein
MRTRKTIAAAVLLAGCASASYVNVQTGERISASGATQNADLAACQAEYQRTVAQQGVALWMGEIVPACMKARGWRQE